LHAPALAGKLPPAAADAEQLRGISKRKATVTWVPWTHSRLAAASGYGAGITSPGWYHHLFTTPDQTVIRWLTKVAGVLRQHDLPVSTAHVIEAARLAEALAALRARPLAGLAEVSEATKSVMCDGDEAAAAFVTQDLVVGERLGAVPDRAPAVPLDADLRTQARAVRLKIQALDRNLALDLRKETDRGRSVLLHRLGMLGIDWGAVTEDTAALSAVVDALAARVCAGLPAAVTSLADDAAGQMRAAVDGMQAALALHAQDERGKAAHELWIAALTALVAVAAATICFLVGAALVWCDYHWLTDVAAGWALAALIVWAVGQAQQRHRAERPTSHTTEPRMAELHTAEPHGRATRQSHTAERHRAEEHTR
jgi:Family of unknown function (DUF5682)/PAP2 superfamily